MGQPNPVFTVENSEDNNPIHATHNNNNQKIIIIIIIIIIIRIIIIIIINSFHHLHMLTCGVWVEPLHLGQLQF